jgi:hypothetical protein
LSACLQAKEVKKAASLNLAAAALKQQHWPEAVKQATRVLDVDPGNVKALYRCASMQLPWARGWVLRYGTSLTQC